MSNEITHDDTVEFQRHRDNEETGGVFQFQKPIGFDPAELDERKDQIIQAYKDANWDGVLALVEQWVSQDLQEQHAEVVRSIGSYFTQGNAEVSKWGFIFATGLDAAEGNSMEDVAKRLGVTRAAISKEARAWCERLRLPESRYMRSSGAVATYAKRATAVHAAKIEDEFERERLPDQLINIGPLCKVTRTSLTMKDGATWDDYMAVMGALAMMNGCLQWYVGDWLCQAERVYGDKYKNLPEWLSGLGWGYQILANCKYVSANVDFSLRNENLGWHHHYAVAHLPANEQKRWLDLAVEHKLPVKLLRESIRQNQLITSKTAPPSVRADTIEQWAGLPLRQWKRNVFERLLPTASKDRLATWAKCLKPAADMYASVKERLQ